MIDKSVGQGDDGVPWDIPILDGEGNQLDITGAAIVVHYRINDASSPAVEVAGSVVGTAPDTKARFMILAANTTTPGIYDVDWIITLAGETFSYPANIGRPNMSLEVFEKP